MLSLSLAAGFTVSVACEDSALEALLARTFTAFLTPGQARASLEVRRPMALRPPPATRALPEVRPVADGGLRVEGEDYTVEVAPEGLRATVVGEGPFPVETALKTLLAGHLARRGGLLVHGVAVAWEGRAALWTGPSGAGKSTLGALWRQAGGTVLADELVAVWPEAGGFRAAGTPWNTGVPQEAELRVVGTLAWEDSPRWEASSPGEVARVLLLNALLPESSASGRAFLLSAASRLLASVRTARLVFARELSVAPLLRTALQAP